MMVEGGNIDHAGHGNDGGTSMREIINFNDAIRVAYDFYLQHPDETLMSSPPTMRQAACR